jgi:hypothetical protein
VPISALGGNDSVIQFQLNRLDSPNVYLISNTILQVQVVILQSLNNSLPETDAQVAPVNNIAHSLWKSCNIAVNDKLVTKSSFHYNYMAYLRTVLNYSSDVKLSHLQTQGYFDDTSGHMGASSSNQGFMQRMEYFREDRVRTKAYKAGGSMFSKI